MISCKHASELMSKQADQKLSFKEEVALKLHLFICESCEKFRGQIKLLREAFTLQQSRELESNEDIPAAPREAKQRLLEKIRKHNKT